MKRGKLYDKVYDTIYKFLEWRQNS